MFSLFSQFSVYQSLNSSFHPFHCFHLSDSLWMHLQHVFNTSIYSFIHPAVCASFHPLSSDFIHLLISQISLCPSSRVYLSIIPFIYRSALVINHLCWFICPWNGSLFKTWSPLSLLITWTTNIKVFMNIWKLHCEMIKMWRNTFFFFTPRTIFKIKILHENIKSLNVPLCFFLLFYQIVNVPVQTHNFKLWTKSSLQRVSCALPPPAVHEALLQDQTRHIRSHPEGVLETRVGPTRPAVRWQQTEAIRGTFSVLQPGN